MNGIFIQQLWQNPRIFWLVTFVVVFSICLHEFFHAYTALKMGDSTAAERGHLTLNPLKQMGVISLVMFLLLGFAWGAVPVDPARLKNHYRWGALATSLAGPAANLLLFVLAWTGFGLMMAHTPGGSFEAAKQFVFFLGIMNCVMLIFNLLPVPGLDGWNACQELFPAMHRVSGEVFKGALMFLIFAALFGVHYLFEFSEWVMKKAPETFVRVEIPAAVAGDDAGRAALALHEKLWNSEGLESKQFCRAAGFPDQWRKLLSQPLSVKNTFEPVPRKNITVLYSERYGDDALVLLVGATGYRQPDEAIMAYWLKRADGRWRAADLGDAGKLIQDMNTLRLGRPLPADAEKFEDFLQRFLTRTKDLKWQYEHSSPVIRPHLYFMGREAGLPVRKIFLLSPLMVDSVTVEAIESMHGGRDMLVRFRARDIRSGTTRPDNDRTETVLFTYCEPAGWLWCWLPAPAQIPILEKTEKKPSAG